MAKTPKRPRDPNQLAKFIVDIASGEGPEERPKDEAAMALGSKGGKARAERMSPERRAEIARAAAKKRWQTKNDSTSNE
jgi:hypothetical protein